MGPLMEPQQPLSPYIQVATVGQHPPYSYLRSVYRDILLYVAFHVLVNDRFSYTKADCTSPPRRRAGVKFQAFEPVSLRGIEFLFVILWAGLCTMYTWSLELG